MARLIRRGSLVLGLVAAGLPLLFTGLAHAAHAITSVTPSALGEGATNVTVEITGTNFLPTAEVTIDGTGVTITSPTVDSTTKITLSMTVSAGAAATPARTLKVTNAGPDEETKPFTINPRPIVDTVAPSTGVNGETGKTVTLTGSGFVTTSPGTAVSFSGDGIAVTSKTVDSATQITLQVDIGSSATTGARSITVTNPDSGTSTKANAFTVSAPTPTTTTTTTTPPPPAATITGVSPDTVQQGTVAILVVAGTDLDEFIGIDFGPGFFLAQFFVASPELALFVVSVDDEAPLGPRDVLLHDQGETDTCVGCLTVVEQGYHLVAADGGLFGFGSETFHGSLGATKLNAPIVGLAEEPFGDGYWMVAADGGVFAFGGAGYFGSTGGIRLNRPIVGMAPTPSGEGYWLVASDGGVFAFGDATFQGSTGGIKLNQPIVGMAADPVGEGYWLVAADGGIFAFDAEFHGSTGGIKLNQPIVGMAAAPFGDGYWLVASDGGVFAFGDATFQGSTGGIKLNQPIVGMAASPDGGGYRLVASDGGVFGFGNAAFKGSTGGIKLNQPVVAIG
jgi:hypothetical protein